MKQVVLSTLLLFGTWLLLTADLAPENLLIGAGASVLISLMFRRVEVLRGIRLSPKSFVFFVLYVFVLLFEIIKANLDVARRVVMPRIPINPGIVEVKTRLKTPIARMVLANSITLTPGTLTVAVAKDTLLVHWIDVKGKGDVTKATQEIAASFEKYLEVIYG